MTWISTFRKFDYWTSAGVHDGLDPTVANYLKTTNAVALILAILTFVNIFVFYFAGSLNGSLLVFLLTIAYLLTPFWSRYGYVSFAKNWVIILGNVSLAIGVDIFGSDSGMDFLFLPISALPFLLYSRSERQSMAWGVLLSFCMIVASYGTDMGSIHTPWHISSGISADRVHFIWLTMAMNAWLMIVCFLGFSGEIIGRYEARLSNTMDRVTTAYGLVVHDAAGYIATIQRATSELRHTVAPNAPEVPLLSKIHVALDRLETLMDSLRAYLREDGSREALLATGSIRLEDVFADILGQRVELRTAELEAMNRELISQKEELRLARISAESASLAKSDFLASMSHELRTPLGVMLGYAEMLNSAPADSKKVAIGIDRILNNGQHLLGLLNEILDLSKVEAGKLDVGIAAVDTAAFLRDIRSLFQRTASIKGIAFDVTISDHLPDRLMTDEMRLRQILLNLVGNALKFTKAGSVKVLVRYEFSEEQRTKLIIEVSDTGCGIAAIDQSRIFEPFTQAEKYITRNYGGTGLGLGLSRKLSRKLGGDVVLGSSVLGQGSTFVLTIDAGPVPSHNTWVAMKDLDEERVQASPSVLPQLAPTSAKLQNLSILVVEDYLDNQNLIRLVLEHEGAVVEVASDGLSAIEKAKSMHFDVVLMDIQMPLMDGYEAVAHLREHGYTVPIIALSAHAMTGEMERSLEVGCQGYLSKPIDRTKVIQKIRDLLA